ncbi:MAG: MotA/TolQ/ExbB proton channel family protein [Elusimicrobiota bacterium]
MDISTIVGLVCGLGSVYYVMLHGKVAHLIFNMEAAIIVFGGIVGATLVSYPVDMIIRALVASKMSLFPPKQQAPDLAIHTVVNLAEVAKRNGIPSLAKELPNIKDKFLSYAVQMLVDGYEPDLVRENLEKEIVFTRQRHQQITGVFRTMGTYSPIFGLLGTLLGVMQVLKNLQDAEAMGTSMAVAVTATFYGVFGTNFLFLPLAAKLNVYSEKEVLLKEVMIEGIISIQAGEVPLVVSKKLETFLSHQVREKMLPKNKKRK